jgi:iron(III) transport system substrate-binding protein
MKLRTLIAGPLLAALVLGACSSGSSESTTDVPTGGSITVYSGRNEALVKPLFDQFTAKTGITVNARYGDSGELAALITTEGKATPADVFFAQDAGALGAVQAASQFKKLPSTILNEVPEQFRSEQGNWVGVSGRLRVVVYNPSEVPTPPTTIDELLDPKWSGKIGYAPTNASWQSFVTALRIERGEAGARKWLEGFAANKPVAFEKNAAIRDAVNAGQVPLGLVNHYYLYEKIAKEGQAAVTAKNAYFAPGDVGGLVNVAGVGILKETMRPKASEAFVQFLLSTEGQTYFAQKTFEYPLAGGVQPAATIPSLTSLNPPAIDLSDLDSIQQTQELLAQTGLLTK